MAKKKRRVRRGEMRGKRTSLGMGGGMRGRAGRRDG